MSKSNKQSTAGVFRGSNATNKVPPSCIGQKMTGMVRMWYLELKMQQVRYD